MQKQDYLWKGIVCKLFPDFMRLIHPEIEHVLDLDRDCEFLDKELQQVDQLAHGKYAQRIVDHLVKVYTKEGNGDYILLHIEVQGRFSANFSERMFQYYYLLKNKYKRSVAAYAIFTEASGRQRPNRFVSSFHGTELNYKFNTYKISTASHHDLTNSENPFAIIILAARANYEGKYFKKPRLRDLHIKDLKIELIKKLLKLNLDNNKRIDIFYFIINYISFEFAETSHIFANELAVLTKNTKVMGVVEELVKYEKIVSFREGEKTGKKIGKQEGKMEANKEMQKKHIIGLILKTELNDEQIADFLEAPLKLVTSLRTSIN